MKKLLALLLIIVMVLSLCACGAGEQTPTTETTEPTKASVGADTGAEEGLMAFTVTVVHADGSTKDFSYQSADKYLGMVLIENGLIKGNDGPYGLEITEVDGEKAVYNEDKAYWAIYIGDEYATTGIDSIELEDGATYKLEYTRG